MSTAIFISAAVIAFVAWAIVKVGTAKDPEEQARDDNEQMDQLRRTTHRIDATHALRLCAEHRELSEIERAYLGSQFN